MRVIATILLALAAAPETPAPLPRGEVVPNVVCAAQPEQTYAAYLPAAYDPGKPAPILYLLDARRRALEPLERFREAAERYGWILASSYNSESDAPFAPNFHAMRAMWEDTHRRFAIDPRRVYISGFSGTARAACRLAQAAEKGSFAGVIGCGGGFADDFPPNRYLPFGYFGTAGNTDFNYGEMRRLDATLSALGVRHRLAVFDGPHSWPPPAVCERAIEWMELEAMRSGARSRDEALAARWLESGVAEAAALEAAGQRGDALACYREIVVDFDGMTDLSTARVSLGRLEADPGARQELEKRVKLENEEEGTYQDLANKLMADLRSEDPLPPQRVAQDLRLPALRRRAESGQTEAERLSARRLLSALFVQTSYYLPKDYLGRRDARRAALCVAVATEVSPQRAGAVFYTFACLQAQAGDRKGALSSLKTAVERGFRDAELMEKDPDLESLRAEGNFRKILEQLKEKRPPS
jgi:predicted esterase